MATLSDDRKFLQGVKELDATERMSWPSTEPEDESSCDDTEDETRREIYDEQVECRLEDFRHTTTDVRSNDEEEEEESDLPQVSGGSLQETEEAAEDGACVGVEIRLEDLCFLAVDKEESNSLSNDHQAKVVEGEACDRSPTQYASEIPKSELSGVELTLDDFNSFFVIDEEQEICEAPKIHLKLKAPQSKRFSGRKWWSRKKAGKTTSNKKAGKQEDETSVAETVETTKAGDESATSPIYITEKGQAVTVELSSEDDALSRNPVSTDDTYGDASTIVSNESHSNSTCHTHSSGSSGSGSEDDSYTGTETLSTYETGTSELYSDTVPTLTPGRFGGLELSVL